MTSCGLTRRAVRPQGKSFRKDTQAEDDLWFVLFAFFNVFWSTVYLESWKRRSAELAHSWGTFETRDELIQEPRPLFKVGQPAGRAGRVAGGKELANRLVE